jgi:hypothetical protein
MNAIDVPVAFVALSENRSRLWLSLLLFFRAIIESVKIVVVLGNQGFFFALMTRTTTKTTNTEMKTLSNE